jgi:hypothetical protein
MTGTTLHDMISHRADADDLLLIRSEVRRLCDKYGNEYWR